LSWGGGWVGFEKKGKGFLERFDGWVKVKKMICWWRRKNQKKDVKRSRIYKVEVVIWCEN
jgi:uncharacterized protein YfbU (UPF0304 family)